MTRVNTLLVLICSFIRRQYWTKPATIRSFISIQGLAGAKNNFSRFYSFGNTRGWRQYTPTPATLNTPFPLEESGYQKESVVRVGDLIRCGLSTWPQTTPIGVYFASNVLCAFYPLFLCYLLWYHFWEINNVFFVSLWCSPTAFRMSYLWINFTFIGILQSLLLLLTHLSTAIARLSCILRQKYQMFEHNSPF